VYMFFMFSVLRSYEHESYSIVLITKQWGGALETCICA